MTEWRRKVFKEAKRKLSLMVGAVFGKYFLDIIFGLSRRITINNEALDDLLRKKRSVIVCSWHGRLLFPFYDLRNRKPIGLAGMHHDAELITRVGEKMGWKMIRGSSSEGGTTGFRQMVKVGKGGKAVMFITPDGPKGPSRRAKDGAVRIAMATGAVLLPVSGQARRRWEAVNWETFVVPKPFGIICCVYGEPIEMSAGGNMDDYRRMLEQELERVERQADEAVARKT